MTRLRFLVLAALLAVVVHPALRAQAAPRPARKPASAPARVTPAAPARAQFVRELGGVQEYRLANGLQILLFPDASLDTTSVNVTYRVGSRYEGQGEFGMAHLLEHLQFKGTPTHRDIPDEYGHRGVRYNASTTVDRTNYVSEFNANDDTLAWTLAMEADRMRNSFIARADLDKEMTVVRNEYERGETDPMAVLTKRVLSAAYTWHAYGHVPIGPKSDIENVPIENLQAFYRRWYRPDNATLLVAGRFDRDAVLRVAEREFGAVARPDTPMAQPYTVEPPQDGRRSVQVHRTGGQPIVMAYWHVPARSHPDSAAIVVYELLMSMQPSGTLYKDLRMTRMAVGLDMSGLGGHDPAGAQAVATFGPDADVDKAQKVLLDDVEGRTDSRFTEADIQRVRDLALVDYREQMKNPQGLMPLLVEMVGSGDWRLLFLLMDELPKVTLADVQRVRAKYFVPSNRTLGRYVPSASTEGVDIPAAPPLDTRLAALKAPPVVTPGEAFVPTIANLEARTQRERLPSGIVLQTLRKQTRGDAVSMTIVLNWASERETIPLPGTDVIGELMGQGSATMSHQELQDTLVRLHAGLGISSGNQFVRVVLQAEKDTLLPALAIVVDILRHPKFSADTVDRARDQHVAAIEASRLELGTLMNMAARDYLNGVRGVKWGEPGYSETVEEQLAEYRATNLAAVQSFYDKYWSANEAQVAVVGAIPDGLAAAIERGLGDWKKPGAPPFVHDDAGYVDLGNARFDAQADDKASASLHMWRGLALRHEDPDYQPLLLASFILGGGSMESRLNTRVRRELGLTYGATSALTVDYWNDNGGLSIDVTFAPQNRDKVIAAVNDELAAVTRDGFTEAELARAKKDILEGTRLQRGNDPGLADSLLLMQSLKLDWAWQGRLDASLQDVTLAQVDEVWRRRMGDLRFMTLTAGDFRALAPAHK